MIKVENRGRALGCLELHADHFKSLDLGPSVISWAIKKNLAFIAN